MYHPFRNEPLTDFSKASSKKAFKASLAKLEESFGQEYPLVIGGEHVTTGRTFASTNPANPSQVLGTFAKGGKKEARLAIDAAWQVFDEWASLPARARARYLFEAAKLMRERKHDFSAAMVLETGKSWVEADADTAEAIDFMDFYAREAIRLSGPQPLTQIPGEISENFYIPLGVGAVIPPWNFPNAILVGMATAAIVCGNTVVLKPASDSPFIAWMVFSLFEEIGLPKGVINFVPGPGSAVGEKLVTDAKTRFIAFTGSKEVGLGIAEKAGKTVEGQIWIKRYIIEMGGKDTMIVADDADIEAASTAVMAAAFSFQGQKCSACSRAIIDEKIYDRFVELLLEKTAKIKIGPATDPKNFMGPVINKSSLNKIKRYISIGKKEGTLLIGGEPIETETGGFYIQPTIFADIEPGSRIDQEEIFGPVLALFKAVDYEEAIELANATDFGLTGAVYTNDRLRIEKAKREFHVGNLYINRKCTGALVDVHPFGGFNMSGTDSKAGGRDYLLQLMQAKSISEKID
jgi:1-pyrroline-5-carboxylate dehydrogenase